MEHTDINTTGCAKYLYTDEYEQNLTLFTKHLVHDCHFFVISWWALSMYSTSNAIHAYSTLNDFKLSLNEPWDLLQYVLLLSNAFLKGYLKNMQ